MRFRFDKLGARVGVGIALLGFVFMFFGWNGAASYDRISSQFPYLISGGLMGLGLVVVGAALIIVETSREERERLTRELAGLREAIEQLGGAVPSTNGQPRAPAAPEPTGRATLVAGERSYHRPSCRLLEGRGELPRITPEEAAARRLARCRVCDPPVAEAPAEAEQRRPGRS